MTNAELRRLLKLTKAVAEQKAGELETAEYEELRSRMSRILKFVSDPLAAEALEKRYLAGLPWFKIAMQTGASDEAVRKMCVRAVDDACRRISGRYLSLPAEYRAEEAGEEQARNDRSSPYPEGESAAGKKRARKHDERADKADAERICKQLGLARLRRAERAHEPARRHAGKRGDICGLFIDGPEIDKRRGDKKTCRRYKAYKKHAPCYIFDTHGDIPPFLLHYMPEPEVYARFYSLCKRSRSQAPPFLSRAEHCRALRRYRASMRRRTGMRRFAARAAAAQSSTSPGATRRKQ